MAHLFGLSDKNVKCRKDDAWFNLTNVAYPADVIRADNSTAYFLQTSEKNHKEHGRSRGKIGKGLSTGRKMLTQNRFSIKTSILKAILAFYK